MGHLQNFHQLRRRGRLRAIRHRRLVFQNPTLLQLNPKIKTMNATNPIEIDGKTYDKFSLNLAITGKYKADGQPDACINLLLTPTRIVPATTDDEGNAISARAEQATQAARSLLRGGLAEVHDPAEIAAIAAIQAALQNYLSTKGL